LRDSAPKQNAPARPATVNAAASATLSAPAPAHPLQDMQRSAGNQAIARALGSGEPVIKLPMRGIVHPVAAAMSAPGTRFRLPSFERLKGAYTDKDLKIPEAVIKDRVTRLLQRMEAEGRLKSKDSVATIVGKIFPKAGTIDEKEFNNAIDVADRTRIYKDVLEADTVVRAAEEPALKTAFSDAGKLVAKVKTDSAGLKQVFGTKDAGAKTIYDAIQKKLEDLSKSLGGHVFTDYNLDDPEVGLGGFARHSEQKMHITLKVAKIDDPKKTRATLIHESAHLADSSVTDHIYYARPGFFGLDEDKKIANAAHFEELPRRDSSMATSSFDGQTFTPGSNPGGGGPQTREDKIRAAAVDFARQAWDAAVDTHTLIRKVRIAYQKGDKKPFTDNEALILEISKKLELTIHEQAAGKRIVTTLDVTLSESVAKETSKIRNKIDSVALPAAAALAAMTDTAARDQVVADAISAHGHLLSDATKDKAMMDWFVAHYRTLPI